VLEIEWAISYSPSVLVVKYTVYSFLLIQYPDVYCGHSGGDCRPRKSHKQVGECCCDWDYY